MQRCCCWLKVRWRWKMIFDGSWICCWCDAMMMKDEVLLMKLVVRDMLQQDDCRSMDFCDEGCIFKIWSGVEIFWVTVRSVKIEGGGEGWMVIMVKDMVVVQIGCSWMSLPNAFLEMTYNEVVVVWGNTKEMQRCGVRLEKRGDWGLEGVWRSCCTKVDEDESGSREKKCFRFTVSSLYLPLFSDYDFFW